MKNISKNKDLYWINAVKAICMICVFWFHSEIYCPVSRSFSITPWIAPFFVNAFFIVSGYLFFYGLSRAEQSRAEQSRAEQSAVLHLVWHKGKNIIFRLLIPTLTFSSLIYIPKFIFHSAGISFQSYCYNVLGGISFWFTSALIVTQAVMILLYVVFRKRLVLHLLISIFLLTAAFFLNKISPLPFPWYWKSGLSGCFLFSLGGIYCKYEQTIDRFQKYAISAALFIIVLIIGIGHFSPEWITMGCKFNLSGFLVMAASSFLLFCVTKRIPDWSILNYIGKNSIVFYFFSGVLPALYGTLWKKFLPGISSYFLIFAAIAVELLSAWLISLCINIFFPFLLDLRKISFKRY